MAVAFWVHKILHLLQIMATSSAFHILWVHSFYIERLRTKGTLGDDLFNIGQSVEGVARFWYGAIISDCQIFRNRMTDVANRIDCSHCAS